MSVDEVYKIMQIILQKNKQDGYLDSDTFQTVINEAQRNYLDYLMGEYQKYQLQRPIAVVEIGQNQRIRQSLAPLIYGVVLSPNTSTGIASFPYDFEYVDAMNNPSTFARVRFVQQDSLDSYYNDPIDPVATNPIYLIKHEGFQFYPVNIGSTNLSYVRTPPSIVWGYVLDSNEREVYNPATSQQPIWADTDMHEIIVRALMAIGTGLQVKDVVQYSQYIKDGGQ